MLLLIHIALALGALAVSTLSIFSPSSRKLTITYVLTTLTLLAAGAMVIVDHASIGRACMTAFVYVAVISFNVILMKRKLSTVKSS